MFYTNKRYQALIFLAFLFVACAPKLRTTLHTLSNALPKDALVVVIDVVDNQEVEAKKIGEISVRDAGLTSQCSYYENIIEFKNKARATGANLIKITKHKTPDNWSSCHRLWADLYYVENPKDFETKITWSADRKLTWADFKGKPDTENYPTALALTNSGFGFEPSSFNLFKSGDLFIQATMNTYDSWVLPEGRNDYVLRHEQIHFDITEIYSRKLRKIFQDNNITPADYNRAKEIFEITFAECQQFQDRYDADTQKGKKEETQKKWEAIVEIELAKYDAYKS